MFMKKFKILAVVVVLIGFLPNGAQAQNVSVADIVARMDQIIKEMQSLKNEFDSLSGQVKPTGSVLGANTAKRLTKTPVYGETSDNIGLIQKLLKTDPEIYPYQVVSGFFGPKTEEAIKNLQTRFKMNPVGVVGPATTELLEAFFAKYPDDNFPANALASDPRGAKSVVVGDSTSIPATPNTNTPPPSGIGTIKGIRAEQVGSSANVAVYYNNGNVKEFRVNGLTRPEIVTGIAAKSGLAMATVDTLLVFGSITDSLNLSKAADKKSNNNSDFDNILATVSKGSTKVSVEYESGSLKNFRVKADSRSKVIELIAEELDIDEDEVEDVIEFDYGSLDNVDVVISSGVANVSVKFSSGVKLKFNITPQSESRMIRAIAKEINADTDDVKDVIDIVD